MLHKPQKCLNHFVLLKYGSGRDIKTFFPLFQNSQHIWTVIIAIQSEEKEQTGAKENRMTNYD